MRTATKKIEKNIDSKNCTFYLGEGHICVDDAKKRKIKKMKKVKKSVKMAWSPESSPKSHKTNGLAKVPNWPFQGDVNF